MHTSLDETLAYVHDCFKPGPFTLKQVHPKPDKPDLTKTGLTRNLAKPNPGKPVKVFHKCNPVKPGPQRNQTRLEPNQPGGTLIYMYIPTCKYILGYRNQHCACSAVISGCGSNILLSTLIIFTVFSS